MRISETRTPLKTSERREGRLHWLGVPVVSGAFFAFFGSISGFRVVFVLIDAVSRFGNRSRFLFCRIFLRKTGAHFFEKCSNSLFLPRFLSKNRFTFFGKGSKFLPSFKRHIRGKKKCIITTPPTNKRVIFLPDIAYCNEQGAIVASLQAWVYHQKSRRRLAHMLARMLGLGITTLDEATRQIFYARTQLFMADSGAGCQLTVRDEQGKQYTMPATRTDGRTHQLVTLSYKDEIEENSGKILFQLDDANLAPPSPTGKDIPCFFAAPRGISIISDIDDTIKQSFVNNKKKLLRTAFLEKYTAVPEMRDWYQILAKERQAAFHYVSSSPIQLYPALQEFMHAEHYPEGSIHLREATRWSEVLPRPGSSKQHKSAAIARLLHSFKDRHFILIGDSGGNDALIYASFAKSHPQQIVAICIRCISADIDRHLYEKIFAGIASNRWLVSDKIAEMRQFIAECEVPAHE